jgi:hypothetical protein
MRRPRRQIAEALGHYRCPSCGGPARFSQQELSATAWTYDVKKSEWRFDGCQSVLDLGIDPQDLLDDAYHVRCRSCDHGLTWPDGSPVSASPFASPDFDGWLLALVKRWEEQKAERALLTQELESAKQGLPPLGLLAQLEARVKALETISALSPDAPIDLP